MQFLQAGDQILFKRRLDAPLEPAWVGNVEDENTLHIYTLEGPLFFVTYGGSVGQWRHVPSRDHWVPESDEVASYRTKFRDEDDDPEPSTFDVASAEELDELRGLVRELQETVRSQGETINVLRFREPVSSGNPNSSGETSAETPTVTAPSSPVSQSGLE